MTKMLMLMLALSGAPVLYAQNDAQDLRRELEQLRAEHAERGRKLDELEERVNGKEPGPAKGPEAKNELDRALDDLPRTRRRPDPARDVASVPLGGDAKLRLIDLSLVGLFAAGLSSVKDRHLRGLQGGAHDPRRRGFTLQQVELSFAGAVDPYFTAEAHVVVSEEGVELEEAFFYTLSLPAGLQVKGGYFLSEFGRINPAHPHIWEFMDQPVVASRLLGPDGIRGVGLRLGWLTPLPWYSELSIALNNADDSSMVSFLGAGHDHGDDDHHGDETVAGWPRKDRPTRSLGELLYSMRWHNFIELTPDLGLSLGISGMFGPNATGDTGKTWLAGGDLLFKYKPAGRKFNLIKVQGEFMYRYFQADRTELEGGEFLDATVLGDWGGYLQVHVNVWENVFAGLRGEFADAFRDGEELRREDPLRDRRFRLSPLVEWRVTEFARLRLQYNFDHMQHLDRSTAHGVWVGIEFLIGAHPAHGY